MRVSRSDRGIYLALPLESLQQRTGGSPSALTATTATGGAFQAISRMNPTIATTKSWGLWTALVQMGVC
jgi:hypothetical protein